MQDTTLVDRYVANGWHVVPVYQLDADGVCSCRDGDGCRSPGKHPVGNAWGTAPAMSAADRYATFIETGRNVGIQTGPRSGIWVLDIDPKDGGYDTLADLLATHGELPDTYTVETGSGGMHYYFTYPDFAMETRIGLGKGIDIKASTETKQSMVVAPPSVSGVGTYRVVDDVPVVRAPGWLEAMLRPAPVEVAPADTSIEVANADREVQRILGFVDDDFRALEAGELERNGKVYGWDEGTAMLAGRVQGVAKAPWNEWTLDEARDWFLRHALVQPEPTPEWPHPWVRDDNEKKWTSMLATSTPDPAPSPRPEDFATFMELPGGGTREVTAHSWDDIGNAERFIERYGDVIRYVTEDKQWAVYSDGRWHRREDGHAARLMRLTIEGMVDAEAEAYSDDAEEGEDSDRAKFRKWAARQRNEGPMKRALKVATSFIEVTIGDEVFDTHPTLLNVANGVINLETGTLVEHEPMMYLTQQVPIAYHQDATAEQWVSFLDRVQPDPEVRSFMQRALGYSITGRMDEQVLFMHHGSGANGKSVFLDVVSSVLGGYGMVMNRNLLVTKRQDTSGPSPELARMRGRRFLQTSETARGRHLDEEVVKSITGGDKIVARHLHAEEVEFRPEGKMHYVTNHLPNLTDAESIWRRIVLVDWAVTIPADEQDRSLARRIKAQEAEGVLAWLVAGAVDWFTRTRGSTVSGLDVPEACKVGVERYRQESDTLGAFLDEALVEAPGESILRDELYKEYNEWATRNGYHPMAARGLYSALKERDPERWDDFGGQRKVTVKGKRARGFASGYRPRHEVAGDYFTPPGR